MHQKLMEQSRTMEADIKAKVEAAVEAKVQPEIERRMKKKLAGSQPADGYCGTIASCSHSSEVRAKLNQAPEQR